MLRLAGWAMLVLGAAVASGSPAARRSTAAFCGVVKNVVRCPPNHRDCRAEFTVEINYFDYVSWGKFGRESKTGERITRKVRKVGTVCILNGRLTNTQTFAEAIRPGTWDYFYEDTWLDLFTTPDFAWGEVVYHDAAKMEVEVRVHATHKQHHLDANPPRVVKLRYDNATAFRIEERESTAVIGPNDVAGVDPFLNLIIDIG